jgi:hypothetical protein
MPQYPNLRNNVSRNKTHYRRIPKRFQRQDIPEQPAYLIHWEYTLHPLPVLLQLQR